MVSQHEIRTIIGIIGNVISFGLFLSPVPTFWTIIKNRAVEQFSPIPYLATVLNCMLWVFYGTAYVKNATLVLTINAIGLVLEATYLTIFFIFAPRRERLKVVGILAAEIAFMVLVCGLVLGLAHSDDRRVLIVGVLCVIFGTCMYASPLSVMRMVIRTKSVKYMPFFLSLVSFLNGVCWTAYAFLPFDIFVTIPNGLGALLGLAQLILYGCYYSTTNWDADVEEAGRNGAGKQEIQLPVTASTVAPANGGGVTVNVQR